MSVVEKLVRSAAADTDVLRTLDGHGDDFSVSRNVEFQFRSSSKERADVVAGFINDNNFGIASTKDYGDHFGVTVTVHMQIFQSLTLSISGFMECVGQLFGIEYDGWGCKPQVRK